MSEPQTSIGSGLACVIIWNFLRAVNKHDRISELLEAGKHKPVEKPE